MDAVVKVGGSLSENPAALRRLCLELGELAKSFQLVIVPGGGKFADAVRELDAEFGLSPLAAHRMAILGMDQYGLFLAELCPNGQTCTTLAQTLSVAESGRLAVFLPSALLFESDPFEPSWNVTSDSIAAYIATQIGASKAVFVTDVDGIYSADPKTAPNPALLETISVQQLSSLGKRTSVDRYLPRFLRDKQLNCYVVNGSVPSRVGDVLKANPTISTHITQT